MEGETDDPEILASRARSQRNFLATLLLSQGVPMLLHGDELGRTQHGNNNTYAQDSEIAWVDWERIDEPLLEFTAALIRLRREHPTFHRQRFFTGTTARTGDDRLNDIVWLHLDGEPMDDDDWEQSGEAIGMYLNGHGIAGKDPRGNAITDDHFLLYFNGDGPAEVTLPATEYAATWDVVINTAGSSGPEAGRPAGSTFALSGRSVLVLREGREPEPVPDSSVAASVAAQTGQTSQATPGGEAGAER